MSSLVKMRNYNSKKYKTIYLKPISLEDLIKKGTYLYLFNRETYTNLGDGRAFNEETKAVIHASTIWKEIRNVRNGAGYIIAKRKNKNNKLMRVRFERR